MSNCRMTLAAIGGIAVLSLTACADSGDNSATAAGRTASATSGRINVVASTNVWGDVVEKVGGADVTVTSIISDPAQDPHSYEANAQTQLQLSRADVVIENGGGYDDFVDSMLGTRHKNSVTVINAVDVSGKQPLPGGELNEHVWYDFPTVQKVADSVATALSAKRPDQKAAFETNAKTFSASLSTLESHEADLKKTHGGTGVAITEPVPLYLLESSGLIDKTPPEFSEAVEEDTDVPAAVLAKTLNLFKTGSVQVLVYNQQTSGPETESVLKAARSNNVAVVPVTETLPKGKDYIGWMSSNLATLTTALG